MLPWQSKLCNGPQPRPYRPFLEYLLFCPIWSINFCGSMPVYQILDSLMLKESKSSICTWVSFLSDIKLSYSLHLQGIIFPRNKIGGNNEKRRKKLKICGFRKKERKKDWKTSREKERTQERKKERKKESKKIKKERKKNKKQRKT